WLRRRFANRAGRLVFGDYTSESFRIDAGLDQGDPHSGFLHGFYNADLAEIPQPTNDEDDNTVVTLAYTFKRTHEMVRDLFQRSEGIDDWGDDHNATFSHPKY
ncbi:hypothetical protein DFH06DRAFT_919545, partial [Mycena polygramma]